jgi:hypothetical protein
MEEKKLVDRINEIDWKKFTTLTTVVSISMIIFYSLGAYLHYKNIKKLK